MATIPEPTKTSLRQRLITHAQQRWPQVTEVTTRYRGGFAYIAGRRYKESAPQIGCSVGRRDKP